MKNKREITTILWMLFIAYICSFLFTSSNDLSQDLGRHITLGEIILQTKSVPQTNLFSYTYPRFPFINHHWLSEVVFFLFQKICGIHSLIFIKTLIIGLAILIATTTSKSAWSLGVSILLSPLLVERADVRPEIFGFFFFSLLLCELKKREKGGGLSVWLPLVFLLWVNMHISFIFGLVLLGAIFFAVKKDKHNTFIIILSLLSLLLNPQGIKGIFTPITIFSNYGYSIVENQNMFFLLGKSKDIFIRIYILLIPIIMSCVFVLYRKKRYKDTLLLCAFFLLGLYQVRHLPYFVFTAIVIIPEVLREVFHSVSQMVHMFLSSLTAIILLTGIIFFGSNLFFEIYDIDRMFGSEIHLVHKEVIRFLEEHPQKGNVFNNFDIGSYLIFGLYPKRKVFVDGRPEAYPATFFKNVYIPIQEDQQVQDIYFKKYNIHTIVLSHTDQTPWGESFLGRIAQNSKWRLVYIDPIFVVFTDAGNLSDLRSTNQFWDNMEEGKDFFTQAHYLHFLYTIHYDDKAKVLLKKMTSLRPHSCSIVRMRHAQNSFPWCL